MRIVRGLPSDPPDITPGVVALGAFDGIHLGHRSILGRAVHRGRALGVPAVACTFEPRPLEVLQPERAPLPITTLDERLALIAGEGIDVTVVIEFTRSLAAVEPEAFIEDVVLGHLRAREIVVGFNHRFGRGARGDARLLEELARRLGFQAHIVPPLVIDGRPVSSTEIRARLLAGDVESAARMLGREYSMAGDVVPGAGRGRALGFATANLRPGRPLLIALGVYAARAEVAGCWHPAVVNVGRQPTFGDNEVAVEAHLLDFSGDLYGQRIRLAFVSRLRAEQAFPSVDALRAQIAADAQGARALLGQPG